MSSPKSPFATATVVDFLGYRAARKEKSQKDSDSSSTQSLPLERVTRNKIRLDLSGSNTAATTLSLRPYLPYRASVEIDELPWLQAQFGVRVRDQLVRDVRSLLNAEFGHLRVYRYRRVFVVRHRDVEELIAGLLRVQFHAYQVVLPDENVFGDQVEQTGLSLTWGAGHSTSEAEVERLKRRRQKQYRR
ncbi:MAG: hypothetical protein KTR35_09945 [Gammaproteobacteria bacterium]|nr:hypothetical protein [Gammaproteobacteria bacterium]